MTEMDSLFVFENLTQSLLVSDSEGCRSTLPDSVTDTDSDNGHSLNNEDHAPFPRSGHRIAVYKDAIYAIGGFNPDLWDVENSGDSYYPLFRELWKFSFSQRKWKKLKTHGYMPLELASHSALLYGRHLLVYGGTGIPFGERASNEMHACNLDTLEWNKIETEGSAPNPSYGHAMFEVDNSVCVFGGTTGWLYNSDLFRLHLDDKRWEHVEASGEEPQGRYRHEVGTCHNKLYVFGGGRASASYEMERIPVCDLKNKTWSIVSTHPDLSSNTFPGARRCHSAVQLDNYVYICGGYDGKQIFSDLWEINLDSLRWRHLPARLPVPVYFHAAAVSKDGYLVVYGGVTKIDTLRTSEVFGVWLRIPSLRELSWRFISRNSNRLSAVSTTKTLEMGIPADLIKRLQ